MGKPDLSCDGDPCNSAGEPRKSSVAIDVIDRTGTQDFSLVEVTITHLEGDGSPGTPLRAAGPGRAVAPGTGNALPWAARFRLADVQEGRYVVRAVARNLVNGPTVRNDHVQVAVVKAEAQDFFVVLYLQEPDAEARRTCHLFYELHWQNDDAPIAAQPFKVFGEGTAENGQTDGAGGLKLAHLLPADYQIQIDGVWMHLNAFSMDQGQRVVRLRRPPRESGGSAAREPHGRSDG